MQRRKSTLLFLIIAIICLIISFIPAAQEIMLPGKGGPLFRTLSIIFGILFVADIVAYILIRKKDD